MKLPKTENYLKKGIRMRKEIGSKPGFSGLFYSTTKIIYDHKTVYDLELAIELNNNGWEFEEYYTTFGNLTLMLWRDLKAKK